MKAKNLKDLYTGKIYANDFVLAAAPRNTIEGELEFFTLGRYVSNNELEKEYETRGLVPADLYRLAVWEEAHQKDERKYFATHWKDAEGKWCCATFGRWRGGREVYVDRGDGGWDGYWSFAGVRKSSVSDPKTLSSDPLPLVLEINGHTYRRKK